MQTLKLDLGPRSYPIHIGPDLLSDQPLFRQIIEGRRTLIITDDRVADYYLQPVAAALGKRPEEQLTLPSGEAQKTIATLEKIFDFLMEQKCDRQTLLVALGGGVIGDMVGFAAACFQRGIEFIQIPTTLLAQVDSSVGGKTAVNHPLGKNMVGAFHQPRAVIIDTNTLATLPARQITAGTAEIIKYGLIRDEAFFCWLEDNLNELLQLNPPVLTEAIARSCANKAAVVSADETEQGLRAILNLGHTFGHAVETATGYRSWLHGEAIGLGIHMAAALSVITNQLPETQAERIDSLLDRAGLPKKLPDNSDTTELLHLMYADKKTESGKLTFITLSAIGSAVINKTVTDQQVKLILQKFL